MKLETRNQKLNSRREQIILYAPLFIWIGVIFFLYRLKDIVQYVSLFTIGHSVTLLAGVLGSIKADPYIVDAIRATHPRKAR